LSGSPAPSTLTSVPVGMTVGSEKPSRQPAQLSLPVSRPFAGSRLASRPFRTRESPFSDRRVVHLPPASRPFTVGESPRLANGSHPERTRCVITIPDARLARPQGASRRFRDDEPDNRRGPADRLPLAADPPRSAPHRARESLPLRDPGLHTAPARRAAQPRDGGTAAWANDEGAFPDAASGGRRHRGRSAVEWPDSSTSLTRADTGRPGRAAIGSPCVSPASTCRRTLVATPSDRWQARGRRFRRNLRP
jgi:hypothetical protein